jgi:hypothetical protein
MKRFIPIDPQQSIFLWILNLFWRHDFMNVVLRLLLPVFNRTKYNEIKRNEHYQKDYGFWIANGKHVPPPHIVKQMVIKEYAEKFGITQFIETGTYLGEMIHAVLDKFSVIHSIELVDKYYKRAKNIFSRFPHVKIMQGDSGKRLPEILAVVDVPCLFWLDGHYSGGNERAEKETPILEEVCAILQHPVKDHIILIDDARMFTGTHDYPTIDRLKEIVREKDREMIFEEKDDIIRIYRKNSRSE